MPDSVPGSTSSTVTVTVGTPLNGEIETAWEQDWYRVSLTANVTYTIRVMGRGTGSNTLEDPLIDGIYNGSSVYMAGTFNNDGLISGPYGRDAMTTFRPTTSANYWIAVAGDLGTTGTFTISVTSVSATTDNVPATTATTASVAVGGSVNGTIDTAGDVDWYRVSLNAGTTYTIRMLGLTSNAGTLADPVIEGVYNSSGAYIPNTYIDDFTTRDAQLTFVATYTGNYFIAARGWNTYTGTFRLEVATATPDVAGDTSTTASLAIGSSTTVHIGQPYDHDWYRVSLVAGRTYEFSLSGNGFDNTTPFIHGIFNSAGQYVGAYAGSVLGVGSASATTIFTPTTTGTYYIDAFSIYEGTYTLTAQQVADDIPADRTTTATVAVNGSVMGHIGGATDIDWYAVNLVAGTTYVIKMQGAEYGHGTLEDPMIAGIYNSSGVIIANTFADDTNGSDASLIFRPNASGTYYIAADGYRGYTGTFRLSVETIANDVGQNMATAATVSVNTPVTVTINDPADTDWYKVDLVAGTSYGIRLMGAATNRGTLYDPVLLGIYDSSGALVSDTFVDDARSLLDAILQFTPTTTGSYYIVTDGYDRFAGTARLMVSTDHVGSTNATSGTLVAGTPTEGIIDHAGDVDRYMVNLDTNSTYYIRMLGFSSRNGDLADPHISGVFFGTGSTNVGTNIVDAAGTDPIIGTDAWVRVTTGTNGGAYYIATTGNANTDGAFLLTADKDIPGSQATTATVTVGGFATSYIDEGTDADWFAVQLTAGVAYVIKMQGAQYGNGTLIDPVINGVRLSTTPTTIISGTSGTAIDNNDGRDSVVRLIPSTTGTYYIAAQSAGSIVGSYRITVDTEVGNTAATSSTLAIGSSVVGTIDDTNDSDWYAVTVTANVAYVFRMLGVDSGAGTLDDPVIASIVNSSGTAQSGVTITASGMDSYARWVPTASGTFYINATGGGTDTGTFTLSAITEVGHTAASASSITVGTPVAGSIDAPSDVDWYAFTAVANTAYVFKMEGVDTGGGTLAASVITSIANSSGTSQSGVTISTSGSNAYATWVPGASGTFYLNLTSSGRNMGTFTLSMETEVGHTTASASTITVGTAITGTIDAPGDTDWYKVSLATSSSYVIRMRGVDSGNGTLNDPEIVMRNSTGTSFTTGVTSSSDGRDAIVRYIPGTAGDFYIDAQGAGTMGTFQLIVETEPGNTNATAHAISVGTSIMGELSDTTDVDRYSVSLTAGTRYRIRMEGLDSGNGSLADPWINGVRNSGGTIVVAATEGGGTGRDAWVTYTPSTSGTYYIDADTSPAATGTYKLTVELWP